MEQSRTVDAIVVGGGPAGLATALMLAGRGFARIVLLEKKPTLTGADYQRAYTYILDQRGQNVFRSLGLQEALKEVAAPNQNLRFHIVKSNGSVTSFGAPQFSPTRKLALWITRRDLVRLLSQTIEKDFPNNIEVHCDVDDVRIDRTKTGSGQREPITVRARQKNGTLLLLQTRLIAGCDGLRSTVRETLQGWEPDGGRFTMRETPSPSAGLRFKTLLLPPDLPLGARGEARADKDKMYVFRSALKEKNRTLAMAIFPTRNASDPRSATFATRPGHDIWTIRDGNRMLDFLEASFQQLQVRKIISGEEAERFAQSEGGTFPRPQYCEGHACLLPANGGATQAGAGAVLLGDAVHAFPPDIGQGVNAALEDVTVFQQALEETGNDLGKALPRYETLRREDTRALIELMRFAGPYQYKQDAFRSALWQLSFFAQLGVNKLLPRVFSPPAIVLAQQDNLRYTEILAKLNAGLNFNRHAGVGHPVA